MISFFSFNDNTKSKYSIYIYYFILCFIVSLFFKDIPAITNIFMIFIFFGAWLNVSPKLYKQLFFKHPVNIGIVLFFLFHFISLLYSSDKASGLIVVQRRLSLFILPMAFCLIDFEKKTWQKILLFYAITTTFASTIGFIYGSYMSITTHDSGYLYNDNISVLVIGKQAVYFALYVNFAIFIFIYLLFQNIEIIKKFRPFIWVLIAWLLFISFMLACKTEMISLIVILLWITLKYIIREKKIYEAILLLFFLIVGIVLFNKFFPKTLNRFNGFTQTSFDFKNKNNENHFNTVFDETKWSSTNTRIAIWKCGVEIWEKYPLFGTGIGDKNNILKDKYKEKQFWYALTTEKNTHNQYLDIAISMGILGLIGFLFVFLLNPIRIFLIQKQNFPLIIFLCLSFCFLTENILDRYQGEVLIAFMLPLSAKIFDNPLG